MIISKTRSRSIGGCFARITCGKTAHSNIQRDFALSSTTAVLSASSLLSMPINVDQSSGHYRLPFHSSSLLSRYMQKRFRSALPAEGYDDEEDENSGSNTSTSASSATDINTAPTPFLLADIGEGIAEVELLRWFVTEGQMIGEFDPVCEVQSDKATVEITSRFEGKVHKLAYQSPGSMIRVGEPILWIQERSGNNEHPQQQHKDGHKPMDDMSATPNSMYPPLNSATGLSSMRDPTDASLMMSVKQQHSKRHEAIPGYQEQDAGVTFSSNLTSKKVLTSPAVRKLARDNALDLSTVMGTGPSERITKGDILAALKESSPSTTSTKPAASPASTTPPAIGTCTEFDVPLCNDITVPLRGYNRIMSETMTASLKIPHMVYSDEINLNRFAQYKREQHHAAEKKLIFLPLAIKAASKALEKYPWLNASFDEEKQEATLWKDHNIGIAMDTSRGLIVPVLKNCQDKTLPEIAEELKRLKDLATCQEGGGLPATDLQGATFTLSNVGAIGGGGTYMSPIITPPQVAIGALGQIRRLPRFASAPCHDQDPTASQRVEEAHICTVSWAADHRIVDGATVARFHKSWKEYMEDPIKMLLELR